MAVRTHEFHHHAEVVEALADPALVPVPPPEPAHAAPERVGTAAWLRAHVARFDHGSRHARRRAVIEAELARIDPAALREGAADADDRDPRKRTALVLAAALGLAEPRRVAADVGLASAVYFGGDEPAADAAVARLVDAFAAARGSADPEEYANLISILIQAYDSTGSLVEHAAAHLDEAADADADADADIDIDTVVLETLLTDPPLLAMRRVALRATSVAGVEIDEGDLVTLDIASANRDPAASAPGLAFGAEPRRCPGSAHAIALAAGILAS